LFDEGEELTAWSPRGDTSDIAFGFADGKVRVGSINILKSDKKVEDLEPELQPLARDLGEGEVIEKPRYILIRDHGQLQMLRLTADISAPVEMPNLAPRPSKIELLDISMRSEDTGAPGKLAFLRADGRLEVYEVKRGVGGDGNPEFKADRDNLSRP